MQYLTPEVFAARLISKAKAIEKNLIAAENETAEQARRLFVQSSSGPYKQFQLTRMGHPYGRRRRSSLMLTVRNIDPTIINTQTGDFRRHWHISRCRKTGNGFYHGFQSSVTNNSRVAKFMLGTRNMVPRRIDNRIMNMVRQRRFVRARIALRAGIKA